jgi:hypothetical protein
MWPRFALIAVCGCLAMVGCGASDRAADAAAVTERFYAALDAGDGRAACEALAEETRSQLEQEEGAPCEQAIVELQLPAGAMAVKASVFVTTASVSLAEGGRTFLDEFDDGWRVSAAGCTPASPDQPYDCELEG